MSWKKGNYDKFQEDLESAGYEVEDYNGRYFYHGPAVRCDDRQDVIRATSVPVQWDQLGLGYIVYPK